MLLLEHNFKIFFTALQATHKNFRMTLLWVATHRVGNTDLERQVSNRKVAGSIPVIDIVTLGKTLDTNLLKHTSCSFGNEQR